MDQHALHLKSYADIVGGEVGGVPEAAAQAYATLLEWTRSFLMSTHPDLGRTGDVCPYTARGSRLDTLRFGVSLASAADAAEIRRLMLEAFEAFDGIGHPPRMGHYRAIIVGFPNCADADGLAALASVQKTMRFKALRRHRMVGLFHDETQATGLWNPAFRPLRSPIPLLAIRMLVENDAAFALRHAMLIPVYLQRFKVAGGRRLIDHLIR